VSGLSEKLNFQLESMGTSLIVIDKLAEDNTKALEHRN
jgi:hypothetical protein